MLFQVGDQDGAAATLVLRWTGCTPRCFALLRGWPGGHSRLNNFEEDVAELAS